MRRAVEEEDYKTAGDLRNEMAAIRAKVGAAVASRLVCYVIISLTKHCTSFHGSCMEAVGRVLALASVLIPWKLSCGSHLT